MIESLDKGSYVQRFVNTLYVTGFVKVLFRPGFNPFDSIWIQFNTVMYLCERGVIAQQPKRGETISHGTVLVRLTVALCHEKYTGFDSLSERSHTPSQVIGYDSARLTRF